MTRSTLGTLAVVSMLIAGCGDGASTNPFLDAFASSLEALDDVIEDPEVMACVDEAEGGETVVCACPGSGELAATRLADEPKLQQTRYVYGDDCTGDDGLPFTGRQLVTETCTSGEFPECEESVTDDVDFEMPLLGECTDVIAFSAPEAFCAGTLRGTCGGLTQTCTVVPFGDECALSCS